jgi:CRP/FNR family transcriptional regulator
MSQHSAISLVAELAVTAAAEPAATINVQDLRNSCSQCSMHQLCLPMGLDQKDMLRLDTIIRRRRRIARGANLYRIDDTFVNLYAIRFGHFKTFQVNAAGSEQITGFQMAGELLGMDAISTDRHHCDAQALEDSEVCEIPFLQLENLFGHIPSLLHHFHRMMSREITREQSAMLLLGNMRAEQRLAAFLLNLSARYVARGYSATQFQLRMGREEIGNYLGLTIESISRSLSKFKKQNLLTVDNREIVLLDLDALKRMAIGAELCK